MNALEIRYAMKKALDANGDIYEADMESPVPGSPVELTVYTFDGRKFTVTVKESD